MNTQSIAKKESDVFFLVSEKACASAKAAMDSIFFRGWKVKLTPPQKSRDQEEMYHAMIGDIHKSKKFTFLGQADWSSDDIKRLLVDAFAKEMAALGTPLAQSGRVVPSLDFQGTVQLGIQTRNFRKNEGSEFIEYLFAYGASIGVQFRNARDV